ncbi:MAG: DUF2905 family protein [Caldisericia bacterium]
MIKDFARIIIIFGIVLILIGIVFYFIDKLPFFKLPGDIVIRRKNLTIYIPLVTMIIISIILTIILNLIFRK